MSLPMDARGRRTPDLRLRDAGVKQPQCSAKAKSGSQCKKKAVTGATVCGTHGGMAPHVRQAGIRRTADELQTRLEKAWATVDAALDEGDSNLAWRIISAQASLEAQAQKRADDEAARQIEQGIVVLDEHGRPVDPAWAAFAD